MQHLRLVGRQGSAAQAFIGNLAGWFFWLGGFLWHFRNNSNAIEISQNSY
jgi:hypothetical protein